MPRKAILITTASTAIALCLASAASAATTRALVLSQGAAFSILGHSCGGIQEHAYATGFALNGHPMGDAYLQTRCGGSGRGGGYKTTTYSGWASVTWDWLGQTREFARLEGEPAGLSTSFSAEDAYGDRIYNTMTGASLETTAPPLAAPGTPTGVTATISAIESGEQVVLRFEVGWTAASETAPFITSSMVTATPIGSSAPVLSATVNGPGASAIVGPLAPSTTYRITVTNSDDEGTSQPSSAIEAKSPGEDETPGEPNPGEPPDFGRCVKVPGNGEFTTAGCQTESPSQTGNFEWYPGVANGGFKTVLKSATVATFETTSKAQLTCTGGSGEGAVTGSKTVGLTLTFSGCESSGAKCTGAGLGEGQLESTSLEGVLGVEKVTTSKEKDTVHVALDLYPVGKSGPFLEYSCGGGPTEVLSGSLLVPVTSGKMLKATTLKFAAAGGKQKPERLEGGLPELLLNAGLEEVGLSASLTQTNEEAVEINPTV